jgi:signal transduction histidine kinase
MMIGMNAHETRPGVIDPLPLAVMLWLGYVIVLALIDHVLYVRPILPPIYSLLKMLNALLLLVLLRWPRVRERLGVAFVPLVIALLALVPVVIVNILLPGIPATPATGPASIQVRQMPLLLLALILTAWHYGWRAVLLYTTGVILIKLGFYLTISRPPGSPFWPPITVMLIQAASFLVVGYFISTLIQLLRQQQETLTQANACLAAHAATLEELTISRERNRLARELHDTLAHTLSGLSVHLEMMRVYWETDPTAIRPMLDTSLEATRTGLQETRRALKHLRASPLEDLGLVLALRQMATEAAERAGVQLDLHLPEQEPSLEPPVEQCLYRVAQEATANVAHHANATRLTVGLSLHHTEAVLRICDDGCGFMTNEETAPGHFGLTGMRERARLAGGTLTIFSQPGKGTTVELRIEGVA